MTLEQLEARDSLGGEHDHLTVDDGFGSVEALGETGQLGVLRSTSLNVVLCSRARSPSRKAIVR